MDDKQLLAVLERQRYRATALDVSLKTGATVEDSEEALAQLLRELATAAGAALAATTPTRNELSQARHSGTLLNTIEHF